MNSQQSALWEMINDLGQELSDDCIANFAIPTEQEATIFFEEKIDALARTGDLAINDELAIELIGSIGYDRKYSRQIRAIARESLVKQIKSSFLDSLRHSRNLS